MITAEEFLISKGLKGVGNLLVRDNSQYSENGTQKLMIEFAKMHVKAALEAASEKANLDGDEGSNFDYIIVDKDTILNAYPESNIK
jgi:hypothetical protein